MGLFSLINIALAVAGIICGIALIGMGIGYYQTHDELLEMAEKAGLPNINMVFIVLGLIILVMSALSFLSVIKDFILFKLIYCIIFGVIAAGFIIFAIMVLTRRGEFLEQAESSYNQIWDKREQAAVAKTLDTINQYFKCCGADAPTDYGEKIPPSCCDEPVEGVCPATALYEHGCRKMLLDFLDSKSSIIGYVSLIIGVILGFLALSTLLSPV